MTTAAPSSTSSAAGSARPARGELEEVVSASATKPGYVVFAVPGSQYRLHLRTAPGAPAIDPSRVGKRLVGVIRCEARRVDLVQQGGRLIEPLVGRPRRVHGIVEAQDPAGGTIVVSAGGSSAVDGVDVPIVARLMDPRQRPDQFPVGALVAFDVFDGATITPGG